MAGVVPAHSSSDAIATSAAAAQPFLPAGGSSMVIAVALSMVGSLCYVLSLMSVAFPAFIVRTRRNGQEFPVLAQGFFLILYGLGQLGAGGFSTVGSWFGPVSITLPVYMGSMMLWNLLVMSALGMQKFAKSQQVGTLVLVIATVMLIDAGPKAKGSVVTSGIDLVDTVPSVVWMSLMSIMWGLSCVGMVADRISRKELPPRELMLIFVTAQATATSSISTLGKLLVMMDQVAFFVVALLLGATAGTNIYSNIMAAQKINQAQFIPMASCGALILNQLTGLIMWQDWRTIRSWVTYTGIHVLILLGMYDISSADLFENVRRTRRTSLHAIGKSLSMPVLPVSAMLQFRSPRTSHSSPTTKPNGYMQIE